MACPPTGAPSGFALVLPTPPQGGSESCSFVGRIKLPFGGFCNSLPYLGKRLKSGGLFSLNAFIPSTDCSLFHTALSSSLPCIQEG